jgi:hypothetical protein
MFRKRSAADAAHHGYVRARPLGSAFEVDLGRSSDDEDTFSLWMGHARP